MLRGHNEWNHTRLRQALEQESDATKEAEAEMVWCCYCYHMPGCCFTADIWGKLEHILKWGQKLWNVTSINPWGSHVLIIRSFMLCIIMWLYFYRPGSAEKLLTSLPTWHKQKGSMLCENAMMVEITSLSGFATVIIINRDHCLHRWSFKDLNVNTENIIGKRLIWFCEI